MDELLGCLLQILPPRLAGFLLGVVFIGAGVYGLGWAWREPAKIKRALGPEGVTVQAQVRSKRDVYESSSTPGESASFVTKMRVMYDYEGTSHSVELYPSGTPYEKAEEGDTIAFRLHPSNPELLVHPQEKPPRIWLRMIPILLSILLGACLCLAIVISLL